MGENMSKLMRQARMAEDAELLLRAAAAAARHGVQNPRQWAYDHAYELAVTEGWSDLVDAAEPITDEMVIDRVRELLGYEGAPGGGAADG